VVITLVEDINRELYPNSMNLWAFERNGVDDTKRRYKTGRFVYKIVDYC